MSSDVRDGRDRSDPKSAASVGDREDRRRPFLIGRVHATVPCDAPLARRPVIYARWEGWPCRPGHDARRRGIAIGPILFIIAILGLLAAAIAAGSGSFTSGTTNEGNNTKASALIQTGENLKAGMDRLVLGNGIPLAQVIIEPNATTNSVDLFSPTGGGITAPLTTMANDPVSDIWYFPKAIVPDLGSGQSTGLPDRLAMLKVSQGVCDAINGNGLGLDKTVAGYDAAAIGDPANSNNDLGNLLGSGAWPPALAGRFVGCVSDTSTGTYWFYQILATQ